LGRCVESLHPELFRLFPTNRFSITAFLLLVLMPMLQLPMLLMLVVVLLLSLF
jgi:hypothetical protein